MKKFIQYTTFVALFVATFLTIGLPTTTLAQSSVQNGVNAARGEGQPGELVGDAGIVGRVTNTLLFVVGALAVIMIIIGGIRYATSGGNAANVTAAKNTILYAIVGLIIAFLAFAAVSWILGAITPGSAGGFTNR